MEIEAVSCQLCSLLSPNLWTYISHVRQVHSKQPNFSLICGIQGCSQEFRAFSAFNSHVYHAHRDTLGLSTSTGESGDQVQHSSMIREPDNCSESAQSAYRFDHHDLPDDIQYDIWHLLGVDQQQQQKEAAKFLLKLKEIWTNSGWNRDWVQFPILYVLWRPT